MRTNQDIINEILRKRGITDKDEIQEFLSESPVKTYDPFLLDGMSEGVDLLLSEISEGTKICIYGDYDADGVTSVCIMTKGLSALTDNFFYYIPSRFEEGYGLNKSAIDKIKEAGAGLIITVDCGCVSYDEVEYAKSLGLKVIVTDHHNIDSVIADCIVIDPKRKDNSYPFRELAGCGIAFKFVQALQRRAGIPRNILNQVLDLVAVGTIGDIVSLTDENRTLVKYGIRNLKRGSCMPLQKLAEGISLDEIGSENIAFGIVPHINAAGRMASAREAVELLLDDNEYTAAEKVQRLKRLNYDRKQAQEQAYEDSLKLLEGDENFILLKLVDIHEGIAGISAGKLKDKCYRPVVIVTPDGQGHLKGTGRSIPGVDLYEILSKHQELFIRFGGHKSACGFLIDEDNFDALHKAVNDEIEVLMADNPDLFKMEVSYDTVIDPGEISIQLAKDLKLLEPFGQGNPSPKFLMEDVDIEDFAFMGDKDSHCRFTAVSDNSYAACVLFRKAQECAEALRSGQKVNLLGSLNYQVWRGREKVQFIVEEMI